ncbi:hypothetical protein [Actinoplanes sp. DH11]|uniref:hypothetical protein n=1 Tax=Actinoplanes sp. DH11 TaxID=2857011 RepID=UPI001E3D7D01|nr:hypothetical protein [Actinoplanes sp. DH11]
MIEVDMGCRVCGYALVAVVRDGHTTFEHPVVPYDGDHPVMPQPAHLLPGLFRRCHLCSLNQPIWIYRTGQIHAASLGTHLVTQVYSSTWHVCPTCAELIDSDQPDILTDRCATVMGWAPHDPKTHILGGIHQALIAGRAPGRAVLTTGTWAPAPLKAGQLPKVRDRLTDLLRSPTGLPAALGERTALADSLEQARLYWIDDEFTQLAADTHRDLPATTITERIVPAGTGLLAFRQPVDDRYRLTAASWTPRPGGWRLIAYRSFTPPEQVAQTLRHDIGWLIPAHTAEVRSGHTMDGDDPLAALVATWLIIAQQATRTTPSPAEPGIQRAYRRARRRPPEIHTISIKGPALRGIGQRGTAATGSRATPDYRYWVSGHTRRQAYGPGRALRRDIEIDPFLKGPADAPIKSSTTVRILGSQRRHR